MRFKYILILALSCFTLSNCGSSDDEDKPASILVADINGLKKTCKSIFITPNPNPYSNPHDGFGGATLETPNYIFDFKFPINEGIGSYELSFDGNNTGGIWISPKSDFFDPDNRYYKSIDGQITVTNITEKSYSGTFSFTAQEIDFDDIITVTNGIFVVFY
ncbi:DUF6252 family protein [Aestuariibaculum marinum]|uniref:Lipoprotein n=1 Tax=Aestuariibaculum marinum TaxID=2683592 RepID=A0A8J6PSF2_9FLAO|nr:DUF6252 family protein [Aestuariibaculum marinum]MBD0823475.1 hypothetical protein [Aestuariibaculum marinum]